MSELRQQLRKRGLPVSGTKPALLQRLRPFQLPSSCVTPAPLCQLGTSLEPLSACPSLALSHSPSSSSSSGLNSPSRSPNQQICISERQISTGVLRDAGVRAPQENIKVGSTNLGNGLLLAAAASTASGTPSPSLPLSSSSPLQCGVPWRSESEQQQQQQQELRVEMEMKERLRSRPRDRSSSGNKEVKVGPVVEL